MSKPTDPNIDPDRVARAMKRILAVANDMELSPVEFMEALAVAGVRPRGCDTIQARPSR
jgi:hypothetical protein